MREKNWILKEVFSKQVFKYQTAMEVHQNKIIKGFEDKKLLATPDRSFINGDHHQHLQLHMLFYHHNVDCEISAPNYP